MIAAMDIPVSEMTIANNDEVLVVGQSTEESVEA